MVLGSLVCMKRQDVNGYCQYGGRILKHGPYSTNGNMHHYEGDEMYYNVCYYFGQRHWGVTHEERMIIRSYNIITEEAMWKQMEIRPTISNFTTGSPVEWKSLLPLEHLVRCEHHQLVVVVYLQMIHLGTGPWILTASMFWMCGLPSVWGIPVIWMRTLRLTYYRQHVWKAER